MDTMKAKTRKPLGQFLNDNSSVIAVLLLILLGTAAYGTTFLNYKKNLINVLHLSLIHISPQGDIVKNKTEITYY